MTGPKFAIDAIALGKEASISIHRFVQPGQSLVLARGRGEYNAFNKEKLNLDGYDQLPRQITEHVDGAKAKQSFNDLRTSLTEEQMMLETERCLGCGATVVDEYMCVGCGACTTRCKFDAISLVRKYDETSVRFQELKPIIVKNMVLRKGRVVVHKMRKSFKA